MQISGLFWLFSAPSWYLFYWVREGDKMYVISLLKYCVCSDVIIYNNDTDETLCRSDEEGAMEWCREGKNGKREVVFYYVDCNRLYVAVK